MKKNKSEILLRISFLSICLFLFSADLFAGADRQFNEKVPRRIISLSPSTTETLFALGLGESVVGVTRFCKYPPEARHKNQVGGYLDPNYEAIAALAPDLVIILPESESAKNYLTTLDIKYLVVNNKTIADILATIETIGQVCGVPERARELRNSLQSRIQAIKAQTAKRPRPSVMISIGRFVGSGSLQEVYIAGKNTYYDEMITTAGGRNVYAANQIAYPMLSAEGVLHLNPDIIIDLIPDFAEKKIDINTVKQDWASVNQVKALKNDDLFILTQDYTTIPGPRFILFLEDLAKIIHPRLPEE